MTARGVAGDFKLACRKQAWIVFEDESGASLTPAVRRTWSPRGKDPGAPPPVQLEADLDGRRPRLPRDPLGGSPTCHPGRFRLRLPADAVLADEGVPLRGRGLVLAPPVPVVDDVRAVVDETPGTVVATLVQCDRHTAKFSARDT
jgi:hypothetical protein